MSEFNHYTEEDFQDYLDNNFSGDVNSLENHLKQCERCKQNLEAYFLIWSFAKNDLETRPLKIDLAYTVANKVFAKKESKPFFEKAMYALFICLGIMCLFLCFKYLILYSIPPSFILLIIPFCLYLLLTYKEIKIVSQKFTLH